MLHQPHPGATDAGHDAGEFDLVVVGDGLAAACLAWASADQNRRTLWLRSGGDLDHLSRPDPDLIAPFAIPLALAPPQARGLRQRIGGLLNSAAWRRWREWRYVTGLANPARLERRLKAMPLLVALARRSVEIIETRLGADRIAGLIERSGLSIRLSSKFEKKIAAVEDAAKLAGASLSELPRQQYSHAESTEDRVLHCNDAWLLKSGSAIAEAFAQTAAQRGAVIRDGIEKLVSVDPDGRVSDAIGPVCRTAVLLLTSAEDYLRLAPRQARKLPFGYIVRAEQNFGKKHAIPKPYCDLEEGFLLIETGRGALLRLSPVFTGDDTAAARRLQAIADGALENVLGAPRDEILVRQTFELPDGLPIFDLAGDGLRIGCLSGFGALEAAIAPSLAELFVAQAFSKTRSLLDDAFGPGRFSQFRTGLPRVAKR
jgi:hypothetical protein